MIEQMFGAAPLAPQPVFSGVAPRASFV